MEKLKSLIPDSLKRMVSESTPDELPRTCSFLLDFFSDVEPFHQMVRDLTDPERSLCGKNKDASLELKRKGNQCFLNEDYAMALTCYSEALRLAPIDAEDMDKNLAATLYLNRAFVLHKVFTVYKYESTNEDLAENEALKLDLLKESHQDCNRALQISPCYAKAWYRRGKVNVSLGNHEDAARDLNIAHKVELSLGGNREIENELKIISDQHRSSASSVLLDQKKLEILDEPQHIKLKCVTTTNKGREMVSPCDIPPASLVHVEEPYAMIILKHCRETHCHYCLNDLPPDKVPCMSCSIPLYCSQHCQIRAGGHVSKNYSLNHGIEGNLSDNLDRYISEIPLSYDSGPDADIPEHKHECQGVHWPAILPSDIVLAGRVLIKSIAQRSLADTTNFAEMLKLSHNYKDIRPESKLELHIFSIILLCCLQKSSGIELPINGVSTAQIVVLISQIRVNSMAIVRMKSADVNGLSDLFRKSSHSEGALTSNVEQVRVGQAIYRAGSLFNHSCQPNIDAYFLSRTLFIRTTEYVAAGCPLELSYGPQVGQWDCKERRKFLEDQYSFRCECSACAEVNLSDLVINAFHCVNPNCPGIVLDSSVVNCEKGKTKHFQSATEIHSMEPYLQVDLLKCIQSNGPLHIDIGYCLKCGSYCDLKSSFASINKAWISIRRLQDAIASRGISSTTLTDALGSLCLLRSTLHAYNKEIAEVEDNLAQAFCLIGDLHLAADHCEASIEILEKLYGPNHIVLGNELVKLSSIQLSMGNCAAAKNINRVSEIFSCYYGSHADMMFPYLLSLRGETDKFVQ